MSPPSAPVRFRDEVRTTAVLAAPLVAGHLSTGLIGFVDNVIAGRHGTNTLAGVAVGTAMFWLPMMIPMGTLMALPPSVYSSTAPVAAPRSGRCSGRRCGCRSRSGCCCSHS